MGIKNTRIFEKTDNYFQIDLMTPRKKNFSGCLDILADLQQLNYTSQIIFSTVARNKTHLVFHWVTTFVLFVGWHLNDVVKIVGIAVHFLL